MATETLNYSTSAALTITLTSLSTGSYRESTAIDNTTNKYLDAMLGGKITTGTSPTANRTIRIFVYGSYNDTPVYTGGVTGSDAAWTPAGEQTQLFPFLTIITDSTSNHTYEFGPFSVAACFGGVLPKKWGVVVTHDTAVNLNSTGSNHAIEYYGIKRDVA